MRPNLIIRTDANTRMGTGHLMRCLALAQGWKAGGGQTTFITNCESEGLRQRLSNEGFQVITAERSYPDPTDWEITSKVLAAHSHAWVVLDGYHFDPAYQRKIKKAGHRLLDIDDMAHLEHYYADVVLNQNTHAEGLHYSCEPYTRLLLGIKYVLLRQEFLKWRGWKREIPELARKVLVTLGGSDPDNVTLKIIMAINKLDMKDLEIKVVVGPSNPHMATLKEAIELSPFAFHLLSSVRNMPELMAWADVAVSAGGSTCWELAYIGVPSILFIVAANQEVAVNALSEDGVFQSIGWIKDRTVEEISNMLTGLTHNKNIRKRMFKRARVTVDGKGTYRVIDVLDKGTDGLDN